MNNFLVDGSADRTGETTVPLERGNAAFQTNDGLGNVVQLQRGNARLNFSAHFTQNLRGNTTRFLHGLDLRGALFNNSHTMHAFL